MCIVWTKLAYANQLGLAKPAKFVGTLLSEFSTIPATSGDQTLDSVLEQYSELFQPELGCYTGKSFLLKESQGAKFRTARPIPYALQSKVESTLLKMERDGVIERVTSAVSAAPL